MRKFLYRGARKKVFSPSFSIYIIASFRKKVKSFSLIPLTRINREFFTHPKMSHGGCQAGSAHSFEPLSAKAGRKCFVRRSSCLARLWNKTKFPRRDGKFSSLIIIPQVFRKVKLFTAYFVEEVILVVPLCALLEWEFRGR